MVWELNLVDGEPIYVSNVSETIVEAIVLLLRNLKYSCNKMILSYYTEFMFTLNYTPINVGSQERRNFIISIYWNAVCKFVNISRAALTS